MSDADQRHVVVIGAGISGLAAAWRLLGRWPDAAITVLEGQPEVGGKLRGGQIAGVQVDLGAESLLARRPEALALMREVGLAEHIVHPNKVSASIYSRGEMHQMPPRTLMGVPTDPATLKGLLNDSELQRVEQEAEHLQTGSHGDDISIGDFVSQRLGRAVVDRLIEPLLGGVYAGHADNISTAAALPALAAAYRDGESVLAVAARAMPSPQATDQPVPPVFAGLTGGINTLALRLAHKLTEAGVDVQRNVTAREMSQRADGRFEITTGPVPDPSTLIADDVVVAVPPPAAARLLGRLAPEAAFQLAAIEMASMAIVTLAFPVQALAGVPSSGFLVPPAEGLRIKAATYSVHKWEWVAAAGRGRGDDGGDVAIMRVSLGRHREVGALQRSDEEIVEMALIDLQRVRGEALPEPIDAVVTRWGGGLPQYAVGHLERIKTVRASIAQVPGLAICGAVMEGVGIPACIASATRAVSELPASPVRMEP